MNNIISLKKATKIYDGASGVRVFSGLDLDIRESESLVILGPSGSGKTTLLNIMGLLDEPTTGDVFFMGENTKKMSGYRKAFLRNRSLGFIFQSHYLFPEFTALENVMLPGLVSGRSRKELEKQTLPLLEEFGLADRAGHYSWQLSGGEQQRVALLRAFCNNPGVLLCDEPTGNLDRENSLRVLEMLKKAKDKGMTLVVVTHNMLLTELAEKTILLKDGTFEECSGGLS